MKKTMKKKLVLAKETVQSLDTGGLKQVEGGGWWDTEADGCYSSAGASGCPSRLC